MSALKNGAVVFAKNLQRVAGFYRETMALSVTQEEAGVVVLESDSLELVVHAIPPHIAATIVIDDPPRPIEDASTKLFFTVADFAAARISAAAHGGCIYGTDKEWEWRGIRACDGVDPEGNVVQIRRAV